VSDPVSDLGPATTALPFAPLQLQVRRLTREVVGRSTELAAIGQELRSAAGGRMAALTLEGEPGIGKTRLIVDAAEQASALGFTVVSVAADEELRGPFLLARSILADAAAAGPAPPALTRSLDALSGADDPTLANLPPDARLLRTFDLAAVALRDLAADKPLAIFVDDLQWADDDSLRLLRYVVRSVTTSPVALMATIRPEELAIVTEAVTLLADMERFGVVRRLKLGRFTRVETATFLTEMLGGPVEASMTAAMHAQSEGVPFILAELAQTYRDAGMAQRIGESWTLTKGAERLVPSAVRTLISRRAARLPDETTSVLALAAILGRRFSLKDLKEVVIRVDEREPDAEELAEALAPAVAAGLLLETPQDAAADYSFAHDQVREFASGTLSSSRRRAVHAAIVELLTAGEPAPGSLPLLAHHAKAAGDAMVCVRFALQAVENSLRANAPEEVMRMVDLALPAASSAQERLQLLLARDDALEMVHRTADRLEGLAEIEALAEALGDASRADVRLRRAAALRQSEEREAAAELARQVREDASASGDRELELAGTLALGQALLGAELGEMFTPSASEVDLDAAEETFRRAVELARELGDEPALAAALRELAVVVLGQLRAWFIEQIMQGAHVEFLRMATEAPIAEIVDRLPIGPQYHEASELLKEALAMYERLEDRRGAMATIIAMGYLNWGADIHLGAGAGRHIEEIRRLWSNIKAFTKGSERALSEWQMVFGTHVFARAKVIPDLAFSRGEEAYRQAKVLGDRGLEFLSAGGTALALLDLDDVEEADRWLGLAEAAAVEAPTAFRTRQLELWRALAHAAAGQAGEMRRRFDRVMELAAEQGQTAARCEALGLLALAAARLGAESGDEELLGVAESAALEISTLAPQLPGHPVWPAQAEAAMASVHLARDRPAEAADAGRRALRGLEEALHEDASLDVVLPAARAIAEGGSEEERAGLAEHLRLNLVVIAQRTFDPEVRARWFRSRMAAELARLAGPIAPDAAAGDGSAAPMDPQDVELLQRLVGGHTDREIAEELGVGEAEVASRLAELYARIGTSSRAEATAFAFREVV
jgi:DNA-binding NarL/FixJ family response regulator/tetratricopeptide (TPR) repeat protein